MLKEPTVQCRAPVATSLGAMTSLSGALLPSLCLGVPARPQAESALKATPLRWARRGTPPPEAPGSGGIRQPGHYAAW